MDVMPFRTKLLPKWGRSIDRDFTSLQREMSDVLDNFLGHSSTMFPRIYDMSLFPAVDIKDEIDRYLVEAELPGMKEEDIELDFHNNILTIKGERMTESQKEYQGYSHCERYFGAFRRDIPFEEDVLADNVSAELKKGILHIELMKKEKGKKNHKKIEIKH